MLSKCFQIFLCKHLKLSQILENSVGYSYSSYGVAFTPGQYTSSQLHPSRKLWASRQFITLPIVKTLLPVTFGYSLSSEVVVIRQLKR